MQDELADGQPVGVLEKSFDELGRVGAAAADNRHFYRHDAASYAKIGGNC